MPIAAPYGPRGGIPELVNPMYRISDVALAGGDKRAGSLNVPPDTDQGSPPLTGNRVLVGIMGRWIYKPDQTLLLRKKVYALEDHKKL